MTPSYTILTTAEINRPTFAKFLQSNGAVVEPDDPEAGRLSQGYRHIWIYLNAESLDHIESDILAEITDKLGARPVNSLDLELSREPGTNKLVIDLAISFAESWNSILWGSRKVFDLADLKRLRREGKGLPPYPADDL